MGEKTGIDAMSSSVKGVPGPGTYSPVKVTDVTKAYSMGSKTKFGMQLIVTPETGGHRKIASQADKTPGPGVYSPKSVIKNHHTGPRFGTDRRKGLGNEKGGQSPGANAYSPDSKNTNVLRQAPSFGFGTSKRPASCNVYSKRPGPGAYEMKIFMGTDS